MTERAERRIVKAAMAYWRSVMRNQGWTRRGLNMSPERAALIKACAALGRKTA